MLTVYFPKIDFSILHTLKVDAPMCFPPLEIVLDYQNIVVKYYCHVGRKNLPWRKTKDPWLVLLSELLLRKTTARQVKPVYLILSKIHPNTLAKMPRSKIKNIIRPLGMQKVRSAILKNAAEKVTQTSKEKLLDKNFLKDIKGVGRYTLNTVLCFSNGEPLPALDTNMIRVLDRVLSIRSTRARPHTDPQLWQFAGELVPKWGPKKYNWGVLDLSNNICKPHSPKCYECPLNKICDYYKELNFYGNKKRTKRICNN